MRSRPTQRQHDLYRLRHEEVSYLSIQPYLSA